MRQQLVLRDRRLWVKFVLCFNVLRERSDVRIYSTEGKLIHGFVTKRPARRPVFPPRANRIARKIAVRDRPRPPESFHRPSWLGTQDRRSCTATAHELAHAF